jgi:hypothetical protein
MTNVMSHEARQVPSWLIFDVGQNMTSPHSVAAILIFVACMGCSHIEPTAKNSLSGALAEREPLAKAQALLREIPLGSKVGDVRKALKQAGWKLFEWDGSISPTPDPNCVLTINSHPPDALWMSECVGLFEEAVHRAIVREKG